MPVQILLVSYCHVKTDLEHETSILQPWLQEALVMQLAALAAWIIFKYLHDTEQHLEC